MTAATPSTVVSRSSRIPGSPSVTIEPSARATPAARARSAERGRTRTVCRGRARRVPHPHGRTHRGRDVELGGPRVRRGVVSAGPPRPRPAALVRRALRGRRGQLDLLRRAEPEELAALVKRLDATAPVAIELRNRFWVTERRREDTLRWFEEHRAAYVCVDAPEGSKAPTLMPNLDVVTRDDIAYLRAHGRNLEGYTRGP